MKQVLMMTLSGVAVSLVFSGVSAFCQGVTTVEAPRVATNSPVVPAVSEEHALMPVIRWAENGRPAIAAVKDYTAIMQKQECVGGQVLEAQVMEVKVRHQPLSFYVKLRYPADINGQQAIFVKGQNDNKAWARGVGVQGLLGWQKLDPEGIFMMKNNKYPLTEMGILNLLDKLLEVGKKDIKFEECTVTYRDYKIGKDAAARECTLIEVTHPVPRQNFIFHIAKIFVDKELNMPIMYQSFDWARKADEKPQLIEAYRYRDLKINVGLTDKDFDHTNPAYQ